MSTGFAKWCAPDGATVRVFLTEHAKIRYTERHAPGLSRETVEALLLEAVPSARQTRPPDRDGVARWILDALDVPVVVRPAPKLGPDAIEIVTVLPHRQPRTPEVHRLADPPGEAARLRERLEAATEALHCAIKFIAPKADHDRDAAFVMAEIEERAPWVKRQSFVEHGIDADLEGAA